MAIRGIVQFNQDVGNCQRTRRTCCRLAISAKRFRRIRTPRSSRQNYWRVESGASHNVNQEREHQRLDQSQSAAWRWSTRTPATAITRPTRVGSRSRSRVASRAAAHRSETGHNARAMAIRRASLRSRSPKPISASATTATTRSTISRRYKFRRSPTRSTATPASSRSTSPLATSTTRARSISLAGRRGSKPHSPSLIRAPVGTASEPLSPPARGGGAETLPQRVRSTPFSHQFTARGGRRMRLSIMQSADEILRLRAAAFSASAGVVPFAGARAKTAAAGTGAHASSRARASSSSRAHSASATISDNTIVDINGIRYTLDRPIPSRQFVGLQPLQPGYRQLNNQANVVAIALGPRSEQQRAFSRSRLGRASPEISLTVDPAAHAPTRSTAAFTGMHGIAHGQPDLGQSQRPAQCRSRLGIGLAAGDDLLDHERARR